MTTGIGARRNEDRDIQVVAVTAVNIPERKAECMTRIRSMIYVDTSYPVGGVYITPSVGDQWYVERIDTIWRLFGRIPFNDNNIQVDPVEGQQVFGGTGPVVMNGSTLDIRSPLQMNPVPDDEMPNAADMPPGTIIYSESLGLVVSDGTGEWVPTGGAGDIEDIEGLTELLDNKIDKPLVPLVPGVGTKISYDENGLVIGSDDADIADITDLDTTLEGKSDVGHIHDETEITGLVDDLAGKADVAHVHDQEGVALDPDLIDIGALTPANFDFIQRIADHWTNVPPSEVKGGLDLSFLDIGGICDLLQIPSLPANWITSGTFLNGLIPQIDVTKIIGGPFTIDMIPGLPASQITSGTFGAGLIPILDAATKLSGILGLGQIPELPADQITSGVLGTSLIPGLPADRITSGFLDLLRIPDLSADKITSGIFPQSMLGITNIAADLISGIIGLTQIPDLNASKITGGEFNPLRIPGLPASKIDSGVFGLGRIPLLDLTKIPLLDLTKIPNLPANWITGTFVTGQIPDLSADKITSGIMDLFRLPTFPTTKISGTFPQTMIDNLTTNLGSIFTTITSPTRADLLQNVPLGSIGQFNPELLTNPSYTNALSVFGGSTNWSWDPAVTRTVGGTGSAKVVADGVNSQLLSDPPIPVSPNQVLSVSHWLRWSGVTVIPGVAFRLSVTAYLGIGVSNTVDIQTIVTPAASSGWVQLSGQYTVPATGVDNIRLQLSVTSLVTAGQIWWDDGSVKKVQLLRQDWTSALVGDLNNLFTGIGARLLITDHTDLLTSLGLGTPTLTAITDRLANLGSGGLFNAANLANILGIPMVSNTRVSGVGGAANIGTSMQETWNAVGGTALASLGDITSRLANLGSGGLFNASGLSNLLGIPTGKLPTGIIPALDGTLIQFGQVPIAQIPTNLFGRSNITDLQGVIDGLTNQMGFLNTVITGGSQANANKSLKSIFSTLLQTGQSAQRVLQEVQGDKYSGMSGFFNFGSVPSNASGLPSEIVTTYNGAGTSKLVVANGAAHWDLVPNGNRSAICRYSPRPTVTDGQFVGVTLPTYPGYGGGVSAANYTFARLNSTGTDFVYLKVTADAAMNYFAELGYAVGGSRTIWVPATLFQTDANVWLAAGTDSGLRQYQVLIGNTPLITYNEVGTASAMDANHRWWGFGGDVVGSGTVAPGDVNYISIADHRRPSIATNGFGVGSFFRIYRANTGLVNRSNGYNPLPSNFFDTVEQITPDFVFNSLGTGELTIGYEGTYFVNMRFVINFMPDNARTDALLYQNGVLVRRGFGTFSEAGGLAGANQPTGMGGGFVVYCKAGDKLQPGVYCSTTMNSFLNGNPSGNDCYWEVGLLNRSLA